MPAELHFSALLVQYRPLLCHPDALSCSTYQLGTAREDLILPDNAMLLRWKNALSKNLGLVESLRALQWQQSMCL